MSRERRGERSKDRGQLEGSSKGRGRKGSFGSSLALTRHTMAALFSRCVPSPALAPHHPRARADPHSLPLVSLCSLPAPLHSAPADEAASGPAQPAQSSSAVAVQGANVPPYGQRKGWKPKAQADFGDGGAYPECHVAQYPLELGRKKVRDPPSRRWTQFPHPRRLSWSSPLADAHPHRSTLCRPRPATRSHSRSTQMAMSTMAQSVRSPL